MKNRQFAITILLTLGVYFWGYAQYSKVPATHQFEVFELPGNELGNHVQAIAQILPCVQVRMTALTMADSAGLLTIAPPAGSTIFAPGQSVIALLIATKTHSVTIMSS